MKGIFKTTERISKVLAFYFLNNLEAMLENPKKNSKSYDFEKTLFLIRKVIQQEMDQRSENELEKEERTIRLVRLYTKYKRKKKPLFIQLNFSPIPLAEEK